MFGRLFLLFTLVPALELYLLIQLGSWLGAAETIALIVLTGLVGAALARSQGFAVLQRIQREAAQGFPSGDRIVEGVLIVVGGVLLVTPGVVTDLAGLLLIAPPSRIFLAPRLKRALMARATVANVSGGFGPARPTEPPDTPDREPSFPFDHPVA